MNLSEINNNSISYGDTGQRRRKRGAGRGGAAPPNMKSGGGGRKYVFISVKFSGHYNCMMLHCVTVYGLQF